MKTDAVIFDIDGTLTNSIRPITVSGDVTDRGDLSSPTTVSWINFDGYFILDVKQTAVF